MLRRTPLHATHQKMGAKLIEFGGWEMPVQYTSIVDEHLAVRRAAGVFDISHMGEIMVRGPGATEFLDNLLTNDIRKLVPGRAQYSLMCNDCGGVIDDLYVYQSQEAEFMLIVNASRIEADYAWIDKQWALHPAGKAVTIENASDRMAGIAVQGPATASFIDQCVEGRALSGTAATRPSDLAKNQFGVFAVKDAGESAIVSRTGYTGEDGFELVVPAGAAEAAWKIMFETGQSHGLKPAGLGARDTLRTEVCYPLYGHELDEETTPVEAGLGFFVAVDKGQFRGCEVLRAQKTEGVLRKCVAFKLTERAAPPRPGYSIRSDSPEKEVIGKVTSGTQSPSMGIGIGMGYVPSGFARPGTPLGIEIRGRCSPAVVVPKPIYRKG